MRGGPDRNMSGRWAGTCAGPVKLVPMHALRLMTLERQLEEPVEQLRVGQPARSEQRPEYARLGETGDRVELVDKHPLFLDEEIHPGKATAAGQQEGPQRQLPNGLADVLRDTCRDDQPHLPGGVLGLVVVPPLLALGEQDLPRLGGDGVTV